MARNGQQDVKGALHNLVKPGTEPKPLNTRTPAEEPAAPTKPDAKKKTTRSPSTSTPAAGKSPATTKPDLTTTDSPSPTVDTTEATSPGELPTNKDLEPTTENSDQVQVSAPFLATSVPDASAMSPATAVTPSMDAFASTPVVASPVPAAGEGADALAAMRERARMAREAREAEARALAAGVENPEARRNVALYPPAGLGPLFQETAKQLNLTNAALAKKVVLDHLAELEALLGPDSDVVAGYKPRTRVKREKQSITLRMSNADYALLSGLADDWPGCRSLNDLLSTAISMQFPDHSQTDN